MADERPRVGLRRRLGRLLVGSFSAVVLTELGAALVYLVTARECFSYARMEAGRQETIAAGEAIADDDADPRTFVDEAIHPYIGYLPDPTRVPEGDRDPLPFTRELFTPSVDDPINVVVVGGSVAGQVVGEIQAGFVAQGFDPDRLRVIGTGAGGYKQPQQLAVVTYLLALGADIDLVINLDGFNEAVLSLAENFREGIYPHYPRSWAFRFPNIADARTARAIGRVTYWEEARADAARVLVGSPLAYSVTANLIWLSWDHHAEGELARSRDALHATGAQRSYQRSGPIFEGDEDAVRHDAALVWMRSSIALHRLAQAYGFEYLHFLQPNQYVAGTKPLSDEERERFLAPEGTYGAVAPLGYQELLAVAPGLTEAGVRYHDLTRLFETEDRTVYRDDCCHFNELGRHAIAERIAIAAREVLLPGAAHPELE